MRRLFPLLAGLLLASLFLFQGCAEKKPTDPMARALPHDRVVIQDDVTLRKCPMYATTENCKTLAILNTGQRVKVLEYKNNWAYVEVLDSSGREGWVNVKRLGQ